MSDIALQTFSYSEESKWVHLNAPEFEARRDAYLVALMCDGRPPARPLFDGIQIFYRVPEDEGELLPMAILLHRASMTMNSGPRDDGEALALAMRHSNCVKSKLGPEGVAALQRAIDGRIAAARRAAEWRARNGF